MGNGRVEVGVVVLSSFLTLTALLAMCLFALLVEKQALRHAPEKGPLRDLTVSIDLAPQKWDPWLYISAPFVSTKCDRSFCDVGSYSNGLDFGQKVRNGNFFLRG